MNGKLDEPFEDYLQGESELSKLYSQSKTEQAPQNLASSIKSSARKNTTGASSNPFIAKTSKQSMFLPFAMAASVLIALGVFWLVVPLGNNLDSGSADIAQGGSTPGTQQDTKQTNPTLNKSGEPTQMASIKNEDSALQNLERRDQQGIHVHEQTTNELTVDANRHKQSEMISESTKTPSTDRAPQLTTDNQPRSLVTNKKIKVEGVRSVSPDADAKKSADPLMAGSNTELPVDDGESSDKNDSEDYSPDWVNHLFNRQPDADSATQIAASKLSPKKWIEKISDLHRQKKYKAAEKSLLEFRKLFPRYQIPKELRRAYEPQ